MVYHGVGLHPLLPSVRRHTQWNAEPLWRWGLPPGWRDGRGCTQPAEARRHRRLPGTAAATPSFPFLIPVSPQCAGLGALAFAACPLRA